MVDRSYMVGRQRPASALRRLVDLRLYPVAIDAVGAVESGLERVAVRGRRRPLATVGVAFGVGCGLALLFDRSTARRG